MVSTEMDNESESKVIFDNPPLAEMSAGVTFSRLTRFNAVHYGLLWNEFKQDYPRFQQVDPLFGPGETEIGVSSAYHRVWFIAASGDGVIQFQPDRLIFNWRRSPQTEYPHFTPFISTFRNHLEKTRSFLVAQELGDASVIQGTLSYSNIVSQGEGWNSLADINAIFPHLQWPNTVKPALSNMTATTWSGQFQSDSEGLTSVALKTGFKRTNRLPVIQLEIAMASPLNIADNLWEWFNRSHPRAVEIFTEITDEKIQRTLWKRS